MISEQVIAAVDKTKWDEDEKQDFYVFLLEQGIELEGTTTEILKQINKYMAFRKRNANFKESNRRRIHSENIDLLRDLYTEGLHQMAEDPAYRLEFGDNAAEILDNMSELNRRTLRALFLDGLTPEELAAEEGVERNAIDQRVHNIKRQFKGEI